MTPSDILDDDDGGAAALIGDLERLVSRGLIVATREPGGATRYDVASRWRDDRSPHGPVLHEAGGTVLDGG
jgi:hypothetical protein